MASSTSPPARPRRIDNSFAAITPADDVRFGREDQAASRIAKGSERVEPTLWRCTIDRALCAMSSHSLQRGNRFHRGEKPAGVNFGYVP